MLYRRIERLHQQGRQGNAEGSNEKQNQEAVARSRKNRASCQTNGCTENENHGSPEILPPETFLEKMTQRARIGSKILSETVYQTNRVHTGVEHEPQVEDHANRATKFRAQGPRDKVVRTTTSNSTVCSNCREGHGGN